MTDFRSNLGPLVLSVDITTDSSSVAVWDKSNEDNTMHLSPDQAADMGMYLIKLAIEVSDDGS